MSQLEKSEVQRIFANQLSKVLDLLWPTSTGKTDCWKKYEIEDGLTNG